MIKIYPKKNLVKIQLNKQLYSIEAVRETADKFTRVARSQIDLKDQININLYPKEKGNLKIIGYEFSNYVLGLMKNKTMI